MEELFESCGLLATFIATLLEGEVFFVTAIISSKLGLFSTKGAIIVGFLGSYVQGWFKYYIAKKHGRKLLQKSKKLEKKLAKNTAMFNKNPILFLVGYKFMFGLSTVILVLSGLGNINYFKFGLYSAISSILWVIFFGLSAYFCSEILLQSFEAIKDYKYYIIGTLIAIGFIVYDVRHRSHLMCCVEAMSEKE